ncbi:hypothetical protein SAMN05421831_11428 [Allopseudospirillum japonicum]|uniref:Imelysin-like domain-containing protein n=1 Tax=Allopseudospirillum japonicum TaxID=64971 RepID=A0A1H6UFW4_9GAMM|nr:imelysin family protein [Allopseudospirillum japonicum]SEI87015.1 hypothetical protein SAMN05421831_11428 [Allopseudospirillum japonicum]
MSRLSQKIAVACLSSTLSFAALPAYAQTSDALDAQTFAALAHANQDAFLGHISVNLLLPAHQQFAQSSAALAQAWPQACVQSDFASLRQQWQQSMQAWAQVRWLTFGPLAAENRAWRVQFWPDKKDLVGRQTQAWLAVEPTPDAQAVYQASIALQGLPALEYLLFDPKAQGQKNLCALGQAISANLARVSQEMYQAWQAEEGLAYQVRQAAVGEGYFPSASAAISTLVRDMNLYLQLVSERKLGRALGEPQQRRPWQLEFWRSQTSLQAIKSSLDTLAGVWSGDYQALNLPQEVSTLLPETYQGYGLRQYVVDLGQAPLAQRIDQAWQQVQQSLAALTQDSAFAILKAEDAQGIQALETFIHQLTQLEGMINQELNPLLGVVIGFNAQDGD